MRIMDLILAFPGIIFAIWLVSMIGPGVNQVILANALFSLPEYSRVIRGSVLSLKNSDYISASRALGLQQRPDHGPPYLPERTGADHRHQQPEHLGRNSGRGQFVLPRAWRPAANAGMGCNARGWTALPAHSLVAGRSSPG